MQNLDFFDEYFNSLILNINKNNIPKEMDICFDGGAFNGVYGWGIAKYILLLEKNKLTKIKRISGASAGSIIALLFLLNIKTIELNKFFVKLKNKYVKNKNLIYIRKFLKKIIFSEFQKNDKMDRVNNKLFIKYFDKKENEYVVISNFKNRKHLYNSILYSCYVPYLFDGNFIYKNRYSDGIMCPIFDYKIRPVLFIRLLTCKRLSRCFNLKHEQNIYNRFFTGVADANEFFVEGTSDMCSYVNSFIDSKLKLEFFFRNFIFNLIVNKIKCFVTFYNSLPCEMKSDSIDNLLFLFKNKIFNYLIT